MNLILTSPPSLATKIISPLEISDFSYENRQWRSLRDASGTYLDDFPCQSDRAIDVVGEAR